MYEIIFYVFIYLTINHLFIYSSMSIYYVPSIIVVTKEWDTTTANKNKYLLW